MANCDLTQGWLLQDICKDNIGGLRLAGIAKYDSAVTFGLTGSYSNIIESVTGTPSFYRFEQGNEAASLVVNGEFNATSAFWSPELTLTFAGMSPESLGLTETLGRGFWYCLAEDKKGNTYWLNSNSPMEVSADQSQWGQAASDPVGSTITLTTSEAQKPRLVDPAIVAALYI